MKLMLTIIASACLLLASCATNNPGPNSSNNNSGISTYGNDPDNPNVSSRAASSQEFPQENQF